MKPAARLIKLSFSTIRCWQSATMKHDAENGIHKKSGYVTRVTRMCWISTAFFTHYHTRGTRYAALGARKPDFIVL